MATKLKKYTPTLRKGSLGLITKKKNAIMRCYRLTNNDIASLNLIAKGMNQHANKRMTRTGALRALIQFGLSADKAVLVRCLGEIV